MMPTDDALHFARPATAARLPVRQRHQTSLPSWLISWPTVMLAAVAITAVAAALLFRDYQDVNASGQQRADALAQIAAVHLQQTVSAVEVSLQILDRPPAAYPTDEMTPALGAVLARVTRIMPALNDMQVLDLAGRPAIDGGQAMGADPAAVAAFAHHRDHPGDNIRLDWRGPVAADLLISRRISNRDGSFGGVILGHIDPNYFADFFAALGADNARLHLVDGTVLADFGAAGPGAGFVATRNLHGLPLAVDVSLSREKILAAWYSKRDVGIALVACVLLLLAGGVAALRRQLSQAMDFATLATRAAAEAAARSRSEEASRRKSDFVSQMSHELRTPLNAILGFSEVIRCGTFGPVGQPKYQEYADDIHYSAQHLLSVINNILDLSKVEAGKWQMIDDEVSLSELFDALKRLAAERASRENVELSVQSLPTDLVLRGDKRTLVQIMLNLTVNAIKFAGPDRQVDLAVHRLDDGSLAIAVADHGEGMTADELASAMRPFDAPMHGVKAKKQDTGLGLPLAAAFAELHGGRVILDSMPGLGTTARLILPAERVQSVH